ncbi:MULTISPECIES: hypothetical protein [Actinoalloteichus]|nr:hypothetical protein [Actinoalloteichus caeruleus]
MLALFQGDPTGLSSPVTQLLLIGALVTSITLAARWWWQQRKR